jgi:hypothetical protein
VRQELEGDLVQDQAKKVQKLASPADTAAVSIAGQFSGSSGHDPNGYLPGDASLHGRPHPNTRQVKGGNGNNQDQALQGFGRGEFAGLELEATRILIQKCFFNIETQAVLVQGLCIGGFIASHEPGIIRVVKGTRQSQMGQSNSCPEKLHLVEEPHAASRWAQISDSRDSLVRQMDQGAVHQPQSEAIFHARGRDRQARSYAIPSARWNVPVQAPADTPQN